MIALVVLAVILIGSAYRLRRDTVRNDGTAGARHSPLTPSSS